MSRNRKGPLPVTENIETGMKVSICLACIPIRNRQAPILAEGPGGDFNARRALTALVFISIHHPDHLLDHFPVESPLNDFIHRTAFFHIGHQNGIQFFIKGQGIRIFLIGTQFGRRGFVQNPLGDNLPALKLVKVVGLHHRPKFWGRPSARQNHRPCLRKGWNNPHPLHFCCRWSTPASRICWKGP